ncbi:hypothetical protein KCP73_03015 [Salmonella enterica subsp. enterica]|nr:hypothetical protein KCP73_03015 [Salmonella enterica subsp. enterica]
MFSPADRWSLKARPNTLSTCLFGKAVFKTASAAGCHVMRRAAITPSQQPSRRDRAV